jgi:hypothetical protein
MPVILATQEAQIRRTAIQRQSGQVVYKTVSQKNKQTKKRTGGVAQGIDPEFKPQYRPQKQKQKQNKRKFDMSLSTIPFL